MFDSRGERGTAVEFRGQVTGVPGAPLPKRQISAAETSVARENIPGGHLWIPSLEEVETPHMGQVEMNFALRDDKRDEMLGKIQNSQVILGKRSTM